MAGVMDVFYMKAFHDLSTCRSSGMSMGPIPWTAMVTYADRYRLDYDVAEAFVDIMRSMDAAYLVHHSEQQEKKAALNKTKA
jgi:hypothetical protein